MTAAYVDGEPVAALELDAAVIRSAEAAIRASLTDASAIRMLAAADITYAHGGELVLAVEGVKAGGNYLLYHRKSDGVWETIEPSVVADGSVTATLASFSPIVVVEYERKEASGSGDSGVKAAAPARLDQTHKDGADTGNTGVAALLALAAVVAAGVAVGRKRMTRHKFP